MFDLRQPYSWHRLTTSSLNLHGYCHKHKSVQNGLNYTALKHAAFLFRTTVGCGIRASDDLITDIDFGTNQFNIE